MGKANFKAGIISHAELFVRKSLVLEGNSFEANKLLGEILIIQKIMSKLNIIYLKHTKPINFRHPFVQI